MAVISSNPIIIYDNYLDPKQKAQIDFHAISAKVENIFIPQWFQSNIWYQLSNPDGCMSSNDCNGWTNDVVISFENDFERVVNFIEKESTHYCLGEYCPVYLFDKNGTFTLKIAPYYLETKKELEYICKLSNMKVENQFCVATGVLYKSKNVYIPKLDNEPLDITHYLIKNETGLLCFPFADDCSEKCIKGEPCYVVE